MVPSTLLVKKSLAPSNSDSVSKEDCSAESNHTIGQRLSVKGSKAFRISQKQRAAVL